MLNGLLLMAWPNNGSVLTSFRWATDYFMPDPYTGNASLTQISSYINDTSYEILYRCVGCFAYSQNGTSGNVSTSAGFFVLGYAQAFDGPSANAGCPDQIVFGFHTNGYQQWGAPLAGVPNPSYAKWAGLATQTVPGSCLGAGSPEPSSGTATPTAAPTTTASPTARRCR